MLHFEFNAYSAPLLFGFTQAWVYAFLFWSRAMSTRRLSDLLFGALLFTMSFEIWEYMLGFGGVDILWTTLEFLPRNFSFLLPALCYFYLKSQLNTDFRFQRKDWIHLLPFAAHAFYRVVIYLQGPTTVEWWKTNVHYAWIDLLEALILIGLQVFYFLRAYRLYQQYQKWAPSEFSDTESVSFKWFRNFLLVLMLSALANWTMTLLDIAFDLDFWHDWWDELFNAGLIYYLAIAGYAQHQPRLIRFEATSADTASPLADMSEKSDKLDAESLERWRTKLDAAMQEKRYYLEPELTLSELAKRLDSNVNVLSAAINQAYGKNFNDFVNAYRVEAVKKMLNNESVQHLSLLGIAYECGFNSKSTFNRAFKKATGVAPSAY